MKTFLLHSKKSEKIALLVSLFVFNFGYSITNYYSSGSNAPNLTTSWWTNTNGSGSNPTNFTTAGAIFNIQNGHTMTTTNTWTVSGAGATINILTGGILIASKNVTASIMTVASGGTYQHNQDGGTIPTATWNSASTCNITGVITTVPAVASFAQSFGNFTWNCATQTADISLIGNLTTINGSFNIINTNTGSLRLSNGAVMATLEVAGYFNQTGGVFYIGGTAPSNTWIMNVNGNFSLSGTNSKLYLNGNSGSTTLNVFGDFTHSGGILTETGSATNTIVFNKTGTQTYTSGGTLSGAINFTVSSGSTLQMGTGASPAFISGSSGTFTLSSGATLGATSSNGITTAGIGATGNIQVTGTRTFASGANYIYNGTLAQVTGNGLTQNTPGNFTISNSAGVTLSAATAISGNLLISQGTLSTTGSNYNIIVGGNWTNNGGFTAGTGTVSLNGISLQTVGGTATTTFNALKINNSTGVSLGTAASVTILTVGDITPNSIFSDGGFPLTSTGTLNLTSGTFKLGSATVASTFPAFATSNIASGTTIEYASGVAQNVSNSPSYKNLVFSGAGTKTLAIGTLSIGEAWTIGSTTAGNTNNPTINLTGNFNLNSGTFTSTSGNLNTGGTWINNSSFIANSGTVTLNGSNQQTIGGASITTFNKLTLNNPNGAILGTDQTVINTLSLSTGNLDLSNKILTMGSSALAISGSFSSTRMIIADGGGQIRKSATSNATASYAFPIGDNSSPAEYSPITLTVTGSGYSSAYIGVSLGDGKHINNGSANNYLTRHWNVIQNGITSCVATVTGTFINSSSDVTGILGNIKAAQLNGTFNQQSNPWVKIGSALSSTPMIITGATLANGKTSVFTGITSADPTISITGGGISTCTGKNVNLGTSITADPTITYSWSPSTFLSSSTIANPVMTNPTATTTYTVTIKDGNGISVTSPSSTVTVMNSSPDNTTDNGFTSNGSFCKGEQATITFNANNGSGVLPYTLLYRNDSTTLTYIASIVTANETAITLTPTPTFSTHYTLLTITDAIGCVNSSLTDSTAQVTINQLPTATLSGNAIICNGNSTNLSVVLTGTQPWSIIYTDGTNPVTITGITSSPEIILVSPSSTTKYSITTVSDANCNGTFSGDATVTVNPNLPVSVNTTVSANPACSGTNVIFTATPTNGGTAPTFQWKLNGVDIGTNSAIYSASALANGDYINCVLTSNANCIINSPASSNTSTMTINNLPTAPTIGKITQPICPVLTGSTVISGLPSGNWTINPGNIAGAEGSTIVSKIPAGLTKFTVTDASGCTSPQSIEVNITDIVKKWVGSPDVTSGTDWFTDSNWNPPGVPDASTCIEIPQSGIKVSISGTIPAYVNTLTVLNGGEVEVATKGTLIVSDFVKVDSGGTLTLQDSASLIQFNNSAINQGTIRVNRKSSPLLLNDYTYWSSPTSSTATSEKQTLLNFSPDSNVKYFLTYSNHWNYVNPSTTKFSPGIGFAILAPKGSSTTVPKSKEFQFRGTPNNGNIIVPSDFDSSPFPSKLIGNPYPSALDANRFIAANLGRISGTLYFWTHNHSLNNGNYTEIDYAAYNFSGGVGTGLMISIPNQPSTGNNVPPSRWIASGQGFVVETIAPGDIIFTNEMRSIDMNVPTYTNANFYKNVNATNTETSLQKNRIWINLTNDDSDFSQTLIGYIETATNGYDPGFDGAYLNKGKIGLYSLLGKDIYTIQSKALPFSDNDIVALGYNTDVTGKMTVSIDTMDGLFSGNQGIFLEDKLLNIIHNLKAAPYTFTTEVGIFNERFALRYNSSSLGLNDPKNFANNLIITSKNQQIKILSTTEYIDKVFVYDMLGRIIYKDSEIGGKETLITDLKTQQVLILKVVLSSGHSVTKKLVNQ